MNNQERLEKFLFECNDDVRPDISKMELKYTDNEIFLKIQIKDDTGFYGVIPTREVLLRLYDNNVEAVNWVLADVNYLRTLLSIRNKLIDKNKGDKRGGINIAQCLPEL